MRKVFGRKWLMVHRGCTPFPQKPFLRPPFLMGERERRVLVVCRSVQLPELSIIAIINSNASAR